MNSSFAKPSPGSATTWRAICGSIAASFAGEPRSTIDVDFAAAIEQEHAAALVAAFTPGLYVDADELHRAVRMKVSTNLIDQETQLKVDLFIAGGTPLDEQLKRRLEGRLGPGRTIYVHPPEDIIRQKLHWYRKGREQPDRQWRDIFGMIRVQGAALDRDYLVANGDALGVTDLVTRALDAGRAGSEPWQRPTPFPTAGRWRCAAP